MNNRLLNLDGIRAFACLLVVWTHMPFPISREIVGPLGVSIFFTLSGFLMAHLYCHKDWDKSSIVKYGIARFSRIAPIYWVTIASCIAISALIPDLEFPMRIEGIKQIVRHFLFGGSVSVFWSISPEVQYYIFFIFVWWAIAFRNKLSFAAPAAFGLCVLLLLSHRYWPGLAMPSKLQFFLAGSLAGIAPRIEWSSSVQRKSLAVLQIGSVIILTLPFFLYANKEAFYDSTELGLAIGLAVYCLSFNSRWTAPFLASSAMRKIGQASFSIYLLHVLVFYFGAQLLNLNAEKFELLWLPLAIPAVAIPMLISKYIEIPLQEVTRTALDSMFKTGSIKRRPLQATSDLSQ